jgi:hypothetical protein
VPEPAGKWENAVNLKRINQNRRPGMETVSDPEEEWDVEEEWDEAQEWLQREP